MIGADSYYDIVTGELIKGNSGPVAVSSKLGWLLAGKSQTYSETATCSNVISSLVLDSGFKANYDENEDIKETLKEFWKHEAHGLAETETEVDDGKSKASSELMNIEFNGERYEVSLPWKLDCLSLLKDNYDLALGRLKSLYARLKDNSELLNEYDAVFKEQLQKGTGADLES